MAFNYDYVILGLGSSLSQVGLPSLGNPGWRALGKFQIKRIEERDHMVIYLSAMGTSHPYKFVEESADGCLYRYTRKGQHDLIIRKSIKADLATFHE